MRIDLVIPYVNSSDQSWVELYTQEFNEAPMTKFRGTSELFKYNLRSVAKNLPWINKVHIIVMSDSQIPEWLNTEAVNIVYHKDFIPEKYLPTFNECTIELFQYKIPGLAEHYLVGNDDYLVTAPLQGSDFFTADGNPKITWVKGLNIENFTPWYSMVSHAYQLFVKPNAGDVWVPNHTYSPHCKQSWEELWENYTEELTLSITKRADHINFNQYAAQYYWFARQKVEPGNLNGQVYQFNTDLTICFLYDLLNNKRQLMCLNDTRAESGVIQEGSKTYKEVMSALEEKFPEKSKYEK